MCRRRKEVPGVPRTLIWTPECMVVLFTTQEPMLRVENNDGFLLDIVSEGVLDDQDNFFDAEK